MLPILDIDRDIEPTVIEEAKQFILFKVSDIQQFDLMKFLGGATSVDSVLKAKKNSETKGTLIYEWFDHPSKILDAECVTPSSVNFVAETLLKPNARTILI